MEKAILIISTAPDKKLEFEDFFSEHQGPIASLIKEPPKIRTYGWDLSTINSPYIVEGKYWESKIEDYILLRIYRDGTLLVRNILDEDSLCWGSRGKDLKIHPLAIVEFVYNYTCFYKELLQKSKNKPNKLKTEMLIKNAITEEFTLGLNPGPSGSITQRLGRGYKKAPSKDVKFTLECDFVEINDLPARCAYKIIEEIYTWFGISSDNIPYKTSEKSIDVDMVRSIE